MLWDNPVFVKEIRCKIRMRQSRAVHVVIIGIVGVFLLWAYYEGVVALLAVQTVSEDRDAFYTAFSMQAILLWCICPSAAANAISQEREQQTWDLLMCSLLRPAEILGGKLAARLLPALAILVIFVPFELLCWVKGATDVPLSLIALCVLFLLVSIIFLVTAGLFTSFVFRKTAVAIACSYVVVLVLVIGTAMLTQAVSAGEPDAWTTNPILWINPVRIAAAITSRDDAYRSVVIPFGLGFYGLVTGFLLWRMVSRFRVFAVQ